MEIIDLVKYILENYPYPNELSKARLNKVIYLIDWKSVLINNKQLTNIEWKYNHYGPYVDVIKKQIQADSRFKIDNTTNFYGNPKELIVLIEDNGFSSPNEDEKQVIDFVIEKTKKYNWNDFIKLVYSTYPIISQPQGSNLNLIELSKEYKALLSDKNGAKK